MYNIYNYTSPFNCLEKRDVDVAIYENSTCNKADTEKAINNDIYNFYITGEAEQFSQKFYNYNVLAETFNYINDNEYYFIAHKRINKDNKEQYVTLKDYWNIYISAGGYLGSRASDLASKFELRNRLPSFISISTLSFQSSEITTRYKSFTPRCRTAFYLKGKKAHLKSCVKIESCTGTDINPYVLSDKLC